MKDLSLYIHIPYCKRKCTYCNFHFSTEFSTKQQVIQSIAKEIKDRANEIPYSQVETIYFGGGTPSILSLDEFDLLMNSIYSTYRISSNPEITVELNPDDVNSDLCFHYKKTSVNRISLGIQSFYDSHLEWMNRAHTANQSIESIRTLEEAGFNNISCDLIFGIPNCTHQQWYNNIQKLLDFDIPHISCYALTVEEKTKLHSDITKKKINPLDDHHTIEQMEILLDLLESNSYETYEISSYCKSGFRSRHNTRYWNNEHYIGFGPSAHSYNGKVRRWNISNNALYSKLVECNQEYFDSEELTINNRFNEYLMVNLRRIEGISLNKIKDEFNEFSGQLDNNLKRHLEYRNITVNNDIIQLTRKGKFICDSILSDLFC